MNGVALTIMTTNGIHTPVYECHSATILAEIINGTIELLRPEFGERIIAIEVD